MQTTTEVMKVLTILSVAYLPPIIICLPFAIHLKMSVKKGHTKEDHYVSTCFYPAFNWIYLFLLKTIIKEAKIDKSKVKNVSTRYYNIKSFFDGKEDLDTESEQANKICEIITLAKLFDYDVDLGVEIIPISIELNVKKLHCILTKPSLKIKLVFHYNDETYHCAELDGPGYAMTSNLIEEVCDYVNRKL